MLVSISKILFVSIKMLKFGEAKIAKEKFYAVKKTINIWDVNIDNLVISKSIETKTSSKYLIGYLGKVIRPLILTLPKMSGYVKTFDVKDTWQIYKKRCFEKYCSCNKACQFSALQGTPWWSYLENTTIDDKFINMRVRLFVHQHVSKTCWEEKNIRTS